jgi:hypothetical protein
MIHAFKDYVKVFMDRICELGMIIDSLDLSIGHRSLNLGLYLAHRVFHASLELFHKHVVGVVLELSIQLELIVKG